ncbi:LAFA_0F14906g1_1 [Lachancea sp. 'fantastica']|nr:LAFA_0F14906g1_1 [Lachancea sp. 'fantastica']
MSATDNTYRNEVGGTAVGGPTVPATQHENRDTGYASGYGNEGEKRKAKKGAAIFGLAVTDFLLISLRFWQFASSVIVLGLLGYAIKSYDYHGSRKTNYGLAVAAISTFYLLLLSLLGPVLHRFLLPGLYLIMELILMILWLVAFIVLAKAHGSRSCGLSTTSSYQPRYGSFSDFTNSGGSYDPFTSKYTSNPHTRACHSSQASIAFAGLAFVLFVISSILIGLLVMKPLTYRGGGSKALWTPYSNSGLKLNPWTGLRVSDANRNDAEALANNRGGNAAGTGAGAGTGVGQDQHTFSTGDSTYNGTHHDKMVDPDHRRNVSGVTDMEPGANNNPTYTANNPATGATNTNATHNTTYASNEPIVTDPSPNAAPATTANRI